MNHNTTETVTPERTTGPTRAVWNVSYPIIVGNLAGIALVTVDTAMMGHLSREALAAVALATPLYIVASMLVTGWATAAQVLSSRRFGAGEHAAIGRILDAGLLLTGALALCLAVPMALGAEVFLRLMTSDAELAVLGAEYLRIVSLGLPLVAASAMFRAVYGGIGATHVAMKMALILNLVNIPLDYALIYGLEMGVAGNALGTLIATFAGALYLFLYGRLKFAGTYGLFRRDNLRALGDVARPTWTIGWPETAMLFMGYFSNLLVIRLISQLGVLEVAAAGVLTTAITVLWTVIFACSTGISIVVGQKLGARDIDAAVTHQHAGMRMMAVLLGLMAVLLLAFPRFLYGLLIPDAAVLDEAVAVNWLVLLQVPFMVAGMTYAATLRAAGDTKSVFYASLLGSYIFYLPLALLASQVLDFGLTGVYLGAIAHWLVRLAMTYRQYARKHWMTVDV